MNDRVTVFAASNSGHLAQIYTGFEMLAAGGVVDVTRRFAPRFKLCPEKPEHLVDARHAHLDVLLNGNVRIHYDTHDSWEIDEDLYDRCDVYFKRSYTRARHSSMSKVRPYGLNYPVFRDCFDPFLLARSLRLDTLNLKIKLAVRATTFSDRYVFTPRVDEMCAPPSASLGEPRVIFFTQAWDPRDNPRRSQAKVDEREAINEMRAALVRLLRKEFGPAFSGGLRPSAHALKRYPDAVVEPGMTRQRNYLQGLRGHQIGVATTGLHGSIGFKMAEYVAFSKGIVSETLNYDVPGAFEDGKNYLGFKDGDGCVEAVVRLRKDRSLLAGMQRSNHEYYMRSLRPDNLVLNTVRVAKGLGI